MRHLARFAAVVLFSSLLLGYAATASAQHRGAADNKIHTVRIDLHVDLGWWWAFGSGARVDIPIVPDGFLDSIEDEFALSVGLEAGFVRWNDHRCGNYGCFNDWSIWPHVVAQWNLYVADKWSIFPELGGGVAIYDCGPANDHRVCVTGSPVVGFGARWHFAPPRVALLMRIIYPFGFQFGITF